MDRQISGSSTKPSSLETPREKKPMWAEEFSVHASEDQYVLRRQFTKFLVLTSFGMVAGHVWILAKSLFARTAPPLPAMEIAGATEVPVGGVKLFTYPTEKDSAILVRKADGSLVAYSQKCTHLSCAVYYSQQHNRLECPCHEGYFSIDTGRVLQGPPPRPLPKIELRQGGGRVFAVGVDLQSEAE